MIYKRTQWSAKAEYEAPRGERLGEPSCQLCSLLYFFLLQSSFSFSIFIFQCICALYIEFVLL